MWFSAFHYHPALGRYYFNGRVFAADKAEALKKYQAICPDHKAEDIDFREDPHWKMH